MDASGAQAVFRFFAEFTTAFNAGDLETLRSSYTDDALIIPPGQPSVEGPDAIIGQLWGPMFRAFSVDAELPIAEVQVADGLGFVRGTYRMRLDPTDGGASLAEEGRYVDVVRMDESGAWKIARAIWNTA